jgi:hypothetical protein
MIVLAIGVTLSECDSPRRIFSTSNQPNGDTTADAPDFKSTSHFHQVPDASKDYPPPGFSFQIGQATKTNNGETVTASWGGPASEDTVAAYYFELLQRRGRSEVGFQFLNPELPDGTHYYFATRSNLLTLTLLSGQQADVIDAFLILWIPAT